MTLFESFESGKLELGGSQIDFGQAEWVKHPAFEGVELKHIVTAKHTGGIFSYHLVRIAPDKKIGDHIHALQLETHEVIDGNGTCVFGDKQATYEPGTISVIPAGVSHEVLAGQKGLKLFAKFMPALC